MPTLIDILSVSGSTSSGQTKSFQTSTTAKMDTTPRIGRDTGSTIDHRIRSGEAPSIARRLQQLPRDRSRRTA